MADIGCGHDAALARHLFEGARSVLLVDLAIDPSLSTNPGWVLFEGSLPDVLDQIGDASLDIIICNNVVEHLEDDLRLLRQFRRLVRPGGVLVVNVPSWRGKWFLETASFRLGLAPPEEMNDHKRYYDPSDLWPLLVAAGFRPQDIRCRRHKFGLNTIARCGT